MTTTDDRPTSVWDLPDPKAGWDRRAACGDSDPAWFVINAGGAANPRGRAVCARCPVLDDCHVQTLRNGDIGVLRANMTDAERKRWLTERDMAPAKKERPWQRGTQPLTPDQQAIAERVVHLREQGLIWKDIAADVGCGIETARAKYRRYMEARGAGRAS